VRVGGGGRADSDDVRASGGGRRARGYGLWSMLSVNQSGAGGRACG
jgi:hypothetical protein